MRDVSTKIGEAIVEARGEGLFMVVVAALRGGITGREGATFVFATAAGLVEVPFGEGDDVAVGLLPGRAGACANAAVEVWSGRSPTLAEGRIIEPRGFTFP